MLPCRNYLLICLMALVFSSSISTSSADSHDECYCFGEVRRPGIYKFDVPGKDTLGRMLSAAGGLTQHAAPLVAITNPARTPPYFLVDLERKQDALDFELFQGDRLCAIRNATSETLKLGFPLNDRKCTVRICGDVKRPGLVELKCPGTVESVLALAAASSIAKLNLMCSCIRLIARDCTSKHKL